MGQGKSKAAHRTGDSDTTSGEEAAVDDERRLAKLLVRPHNRQFCLHDAGLVEIPDLVTSWDDLEVLRLDVNLIRCIPPTIARLANLTELTLAGNRLTSLVPPSAEMIEMEMASKISKNHQVSDGRDGDEDGAEVVSSSSSTRTSAGVCALRGLCELASLQKLNLNSNLIESVPAELTRLTNLTHLNLSANRLQSLPSLRELTRLTVLVVTINRLTSLPPLPRSLVVLAAGRNDLRRFELEPSPMADGDADASAADQPGRALADVASSSVVAAAAAAAAAAKEEQEENGEGDEQRVKKSESDGTRAIKNEAESGKEGKKQSKKAKKAKKKEEKAKNKEKSKEAEEGTKADSNSDGRGDADDENRPWFARLQELDLSENKLTEFPLALLQMSSLTALQLSCNYITEFPPPGFAQSWPHLKSMRIAFNDLTDLPVEVLQLPELKRFDFMGNPFQLERQTQALALKRAEREEQERRRRAEEEERKRSEEAEKKNKKKGKAKEKAKSKKSDGEGGDDKPTQKDLKLALDKVVTDSEGEEEVKTKTKEQTEAAGWMYISDEFTKRGDWDYNSIEDIMLPDEILPGLYLGSWIGAVNKHLLKHLGVTHILTVASQLTPAFVEHFTYKHVEIDDVQTENVMDHFESCIEFIDQARQANTNVLVHCRAGVSRSASVVIAYVMVTRRMGWEAAFNFVRDRRPIVCPNIGFRAQLQAWELRKCLSGDT